MGEDLQLLWMLAERLLLTALPAALAVLLAARRGVRDLPPLLAIALVASGLAAIVAFWAYYADPLAGRAVSWLIALGSVQGVVLCRPDRLDRELLRELAAPAGLWGLASLFVLYLGFLHGGGDAPLSLAATRFSHELPTDNKLPAYFAEWYFEHGHSSTPPPIADWLSSDRPPLQTGYALSQRTFGWDQAGLHYQVLGVVLQQLWIVGMWALLCAARLDPLAKGLAICAALASDIAIVHGFFVWPKLLAAAFVLAALALVVSERWPRLRGSPAGAALFAALCALAMLAHGSSAFALIPLLGLAALRGLPSLRWLGVAALVGLALLGPWVAYQRLADPPGDRLLKWQLGGSLPIDERGTLEAIADGYAEEGVDGALANKWHNVTTILGQSGAEGGLESAGDKLGEGEPGEAAGALRLPRFYSLIPMLGLLLAGPLAMLGARARGRPAGAEWRFAVGGLAFCAVALFLWIALMFGGSEANTSIHVGSLAVPLLAICACVVGAFAVSRRLAVGLVGLNAALVLALYAPALDPPVGTSYSAAAALLAAGGLVGFGLLALRPAVAERRPGASPPLGG